MKRTLVLSDLHIPWEHPDALRFCVAVRDTYKTQQTLSVGDELDWHGCSFHDHDPDLPSVGDELKMAKTKIAKWRKEFPTMRLARSNHGNMLARKMLSSGLPEEALKAYADIYNTPGWTWHPKIVEDMHGIPLVVKHSFGSNVRSALNRVGDACVVWGHHHTVFGVAYRNNLRYRQWAMCVGCLIDPTHRAFAYASDNIDEPMLGCGVIIDGQAIPVPMWLNASGRWTGKVSH
jgi:hypothetical protein